jgi:hypothetical protein
LEGEEGFVEGSDDKTDEDNNKLLEGAVDVAIAEVTVAVFKLRVLAGRRLVSEVLFIIRVLVYIRTTSEALGAKPSKDLRHYS